MAEMNLVWGISTTGCFILSALLWSRLLRPERAPEWVIFPFLFLTAQIVVAGFALSHFNLLASNFWWWGLGFFSVALSVGIFLVRRPPPSVYKWRWSAFGDWWKDLPLREKSHLGLLLTTLGFVGTLNAAVVLFSAPSNWDNLAYRLPRIGYYLQHGNLGYYDCSLFQQLAVQRSCSILMLFSFLVSGRNENLMQAWQYLAYWVSAACVFGISREIGLKRSASLLAAGIFALLTVSLTQSTTTQSDLLLAVYAGCAAYSLLAFRSRPRSIYLLTAALGVAMGFGTKASFSLFVPSLLLIMAYVFIRRGRPFGVRGVLRFTMYILPAILILTLPSAYWDNYRIFNHPLGSQDFRRLQSYEGEPLSLIITAGTSHLIRQGFDFLALDGLPPIPLVWNLQNALRYPPWALTKLLGIDLEKDIYHSWFYFPPPLSNENHSSWGILGWSLVWPALLLVLFRIRKDPLSAVLALAALIFIGFHSYIGIYNFGGRARYLLPATVLALPAAGRWFSARSRILRGYFSLFLLLGCVSALTAVLYRYRTPFVFDQAVFIRDRLTRRQEEAWPLPLRTESVFKLDRLSQVLRDAPVYDTALRNYERLVPADAAVAAALNPWTVEYILFGKRLSRRIFSLNSFHRNLQPVPPEADYLLWADDFDEIFNRGDGDIHLGKDLWLRKLN